MTQAQRGIVAVIGLLLTAGAVIAFQLSSGDPEPTAPPPDISVPPDLSPSFDEEALDPDDAPPAVVEADPADSVETSAEYVWESRPIGGAGFMKGLEVHPSGEPIIARADIGGLYRFDRDRGRWAQQLTLDRIDWEGDYRDYAVESIAIAPSDPNRIYAGVGHSADGSPPVRGRVIASTDGGNTWTSPEQPFNIHGDESHRAGGERIAVSPIDADSVWLGTTDGLWRSADGATTFERVDSAPVGASSIENSAGIEWVLVDTGAVYIGVAGAGVFSSTDDGASWVELWATTTRPFDAEVDGSGKLWVTNREDDVVRTYDPAAGEVAEVGAIGDEVRGVAVSPDGEAVVIMGHTVMWRSFNGGDSWDPVDLDYVCDDIPWMATYQAWSPFSSASPEFDPADPAALWVPDGFGVFRIPDVSAARPQMVCTSLGIEELVTNDIAVPATDVVVSAHWDRALFHQPAGGEATAQVGPSDRFNSSWDLATTPANSQFIAAVIADHRFCCEADGDAYQSGYSFDAGLSWQRFPSYTDGTHPPDLRFGTIAVSSGNVNDLVWVPSFNAAPHVSHDLGATWTEITLPGTEGLATDETASDSGSHFNFFLQREVVVADPVRAEVFYLYHQELGVFRSDDTGDTWELVSDTSIPTGWTVGWFHAQLTAVPGREGHLLFTPGELGEAVFGMYESLDGGATWALVPGASEIDVVGYGVSTRGGTDPAVYVVGNINNTYGIYVSHDLLQSWQLVDVAPLGLYNRIHAIAGDPEIPGRIYVGFRGNSVAQGEPLGVSEG